MPRPKLSLKVLMLLVACVALVLGGLARRVQLQREAASMLQDLGGQLEVPPMDVKTMVMGMAINDVQFLGPVVGDEDVPNICDAAKVLGLNHVTFMETRVSHIGEMQLQRLLPEVEIQLITPVNDIRVPQLR